MNSTLDEFTNPLFHDPSFLATFDLEHVDTLSAQDYVLDRDGQRLTSASPRFPTSPTPLCSQARVPPTNHDILLVNQLRDLANAKVACTRELFCFRGGFQKKDCHVADDNIGLWFVGLVLPPQSAASLLLVHRSEWSGRGHCNGVKGYVVIVTVRLLLLVESSTTEDIFAPEATTIPPMEGVSHLGLEDGELLQVVLVLIVGDPQPRGVQLPCQLTQSGVGDGLELHGRDVGKPETGRRGLEGEEGLRPVEVIVLGLDHDSGDEVTLPVVCAGDSEVEGASVTLVPGAVDGLQGEDPCKEADRGARPPGGTYDDLIKVKIM